MLPVAIVGMSAVMPQAPSLRAFWTNVLSGRDCIEDVPPSRWSRDLYHDPDPAARDRTYGYRGGFIPDVDFDPLEFGLPPASLESIDPAQLLALVAARDALRDAGYPAGGAHDHSATSVILGVVGASLRSSHALVSRTQIAQWDALFAAHHVEPERAGAMAETMRRLYPEWTEDSFPGYLPNVIAGRIANRLDLGGMTCAVDAACASALSAVYFAASELAAHRCDLVITGGVDLDNSPAAFLSFSKSLALSKDGRIAPFSATAGGTLLAEGVGMLVLKRLEDALRDGDRVYAALRSVAGASDGRHLSVYAPRLDGQKRTLERAYAEAGTGIEGVRLIEAHATGTEVGDRIEVEALREHFAGAPAASIALGSVKSQIGHAKAAAGAAGLIKTALALYHKVLPPTINVDRPSDALARDDSPFCLHVRTRPWLDRDDGIPRRAGVSAFGFGGANFHAVVEEVAPLREPAPQHLAPRVAVLSAGTPDDLATVCAAWQRRLSGDEAELALDELIEASAAPVAPDAPRLGFACADAASAAARLAEAEPHLRGGRTAHWVLPGGTSYRARAAGGAVVALFPGQGSQYVGMGARLAATNPHARRMLEGFDRRFAADGLTPLSAVMMPPHAFDAAERAAQEARLRHTLYAQAAVGAYSAGLYRLLSDLGFHATLSAGHSFGELTALWAAGAYDDRTFVDLVHARGSALAPRNGADCGTLAAVQAGVGDVEAIVGTLPGVEIANVNAPRQTVIGGPAAALDEAAAALRARGLSVVPLSVAAAFHTACVGYAREPWEASLRAAAIGAPRFAVASNTNGDFHAADGVGAALAAHPFERVRFGENVEALYERGGRIFVEIGPRAVLTQLVGAILGEREHAAIALNPAVDSDEELQLAAGLAALRVAGVDLATALTPHEPARRRSASSMRVGAGLVGEQRRRDAFDERLAQARATAPPPAPAAQAPAAADVTTLEAAALAAHARFLDVQAAQARLLLGLPQRPDADVERVVEAVRAQNAETTRLHEAFMRQSDETIRALLGAGATSAPRPAPAALPSAPPPPREAPPMPAPAPPAKRLATEPAAGTDVRALLIGIIAAKTGYPADVLEPDLDLESDLGIDSIKRVEILAALREALGVSSDAVPKSSAAARTIAQIAALISGTAAAPPAPATPTAGVRLEPLAAPEPRGRSLGGVVLVADGAETTAAVAAALRELGAPCVVLHPPGVPRARLNDDVHQLAVPGAGPAALHEAFARVRFLIGTPHTVVVLHGAPAGTPLVGDPGQRDALLFALLAAAETARDGAPDGRTAFATVTRIDGAFGHAALACAEPAGLLGLVRTLRCEHPHIAARAVDVDPALAPEAFARAVLQELCDRPGEIAVGVGTLGRQAPRVAPCTLDPANAAAGPGPGDVFVVTGGARGVTAACVRALGSATGSTFVLVGRTRIEGPEPQWAADCPDEELRACRTAGATNGMRASLRDVEREVREVIRRREVLATLAALRDANVTASYVAADASDGEALRAALAPLAERLGPVTGIIHGAGVLADRRLVDLTAADLETVFAAKVDGLAHLLAAVDGARLRFVALFSSTAATYGNPGQANYAMANCVLDATALALHRSVPAARVVSFAWGPWDGGMVTPELARSFAARGVNLMPRDQGASLFVQALCQPPDRPALLILGTEPAPLPAIVS
jgi:acyl transferase domain-containing protein/NADP-dependent 3-hydroxy acid dehydrogenase YdfG